MMKLHQVNISFVIGLILYRHFYKQSSDLVKKFFREVLAWHRHFKILFFENLSRRSLYSPELLKRKTSNVATLTFKPGLKLTNFICKIDDFYKQYTFLQC